MYNSTVVMPLIMRRHEMICHALTLIKADGGTYGACLVLRLVLEQRLHRVCLFI